ncbi:MAG TPA: hypothetical protein PKO15_13405 [Fibrobacteria bacterium]|nr:hypothetical protein [Fibrobacteria bacterium]
MSGGYIHCGDFNGEVKSGSYAVEVLEDLPGILPTESQEAFREEFIRPLLEEYEEIGDHFVIDPEVCENLLPVIKELCKLYREKYGNLSVDEVIDADDETGIYPPLSVPGEFSGRKYYTLIDLERAAEISVKSKKPITIEFD